MGKHEVIATKLEVLGLIERKEVVVAGDLAHNFGYSQKAAAERLNQLEHQRLIEKVKEIFRLTERGRKYLKVMKREQEPSRSQLLDEIKTLTTRIGDREATIRKMKKEGDTLKSELSARKEEFNELVMGQMLNRIRQQSK
ncbi:hypothetical protein Dform_01776 [Dehalogenimonas formicexedens]|uniref:Uncharacterized protein n=1 Tax=Dehalogenimonas formicexedens TaxID=1839801 RepID=A0A1P8F9H0_9CHLR|nr:hypothetical protein [Dehalogenimonas formicexedens]APV45095.1 hypothetical protein Dform_01776 [Dehalogenimonas formicexedens]